MNQEEQKEKYSAFISDVSEILSLGKPIDILKLCMVTDRFFKPLQNQVNELEAQIERMKCCMNCKYFDQNEPKYCNKGVFNSYVCNKWELAK